MGFSQPGNTTVVLINVLLMIYKALIHVLLIINIALVATYNLWKYASLKIYADKCFKCKDFGIYMHLSSYVTICFLKEPDNLNAT